MSDYFWQEPKIVQINLCGGLLDQSEKKNETTVFLCVFVPVFAMVLKLKRRRDVNKKAKRGQESATDVFIEPTWLKRPLWELNSDSSVSEFH